MFKRNVGTTDRIIRAIIGLIIAGLGIYFHSWWGLVAILPLGTALVGYCGLYTILGINTLSKPDAKPGV